MKNKPKYTILKNTSYAIAGLKDIIKNESSFKIELAIIPLVLILIYILNFTFYESITLVSTYILLLIIESINSAIERVVDLVTLEIEDLAGKAKDAGSAAVFLTIVLNLFLWIAFLIN
jgi:diacylglycerol kinase (ATP)